MAALTDFCFAMFHLLVGRKLYKM